MNVLFSYSLHSSFSLILLQAPGYSQQANGCVVHPFGSIFDYDGFLGNQTTDGEGEEEVGSGTYHGEEEVEGDDEIDSDDGNKSKDNSTPLWKYVTKLA